jgi:ABC-type glycerol-3-phosphate transport system substrate-binding protein
LRSAAGFGAASVLAACGAQQTAAMPTALPPAPTATIGPERTITVWYYADSLSLVEAFRRANPTIAIDFQHQGDIQPALERGLRSGTNLPDVVAFDELGAQRLGAQGGMLDLGAAPFDAVALRGDFVPSAWNGATTPEGHQIGMPLNVSPGIFWYRSDILEAAGLPAVPEQLQQQLDTWDALLTLAQELRAAHPNSALLSDAVVDIFFARWLQAGGVWLDGSKVVIEERYTEAAQMAVLARRQKLDADIVPSGSSFTAAVREGQIAGLFAPGRFQGYISDVHFDQVGKWRVLRAPGGDFNQGARYLGIPAASSKQEAAWEFVRFCCGTAEAQNAFLKVGGDLPAFMPAWQDPLYDAPVSMFGDQRAYRLWAEVAAAAPVPSATPHDQTMFELLYPKVRDVVAASGNAGQALRDAEAAIVAAIPGLTV